MEGEVVEEDNEDQGQVEAKEREEVEGENDEENGEDEVFDADSSTATGYQLGNDPADYDSLMEVRRSLHRGKLLAGHPMPPPPQHASIHRKSCS